MHRSFKALLHYLSHLKRNKKWTRECFLSRKSECHWLEWGQELFGWMADTVTWNIHWITRTRLKERKKKDSKKNNFLVSHLTWATPRWLRALSLSFVAEMYPLGLTDRRKVYYFEILFLEFTGFVFVSRYFVSRRQFSQKHAIFRIYKKMPFCNLGL